MEQPLLEMLETWAETFFITIESASFFGSTPSERGIASEVLEE